MPHSSLRRPPAHREQGGWVSARGRFEDDPYTIVEASPAISPSAKAKPAAGGSAGNSMLSSHKPQTQSTTPLRKGAGQQSGNKRPATVLMVLDTDEKRVSGQPKDHPVERTTRNASNPGRQVKATRQRRSPPDVYAGETANGVSRRTHSPPATVNEVARANSSFPVSTSPSTSVLEANDTGGKVKCPVCSRGMDHWKAAQRQQASL